MPGGRRLMPSRIASRPVRTAMASGVGCHSVYFSLPVVRRCSRSRARVGCRRHLRTSLRSTISRGTPAITSEMGEGENENSTGEKELKALS